MPVIQIPKPDECLHGNTHPFWFSKGRKIRICNIARPHLELIIRMLDQSRNLGYNVGSKQGQDDRRWYAIMKGELDRRDS